MDTYINKKLIEDGLMADVIRPVLDDEGLKAHIGDYWFYFGGTEFEYTEPDKIPFEILVSEIKSVLDEFQRLPEFNDEYMYYYSYLCENI